jgi:serine-type D-Ala-D-Ala carboxypeptidase (penicillin-binding protein 5/6)
MGGRVALLVVAVGAALGFAGAADARDPPPIKARAALVANGATGEILFARNADRRAAIASITKLMTALVVLDRARPTELVTVRRRDASVGESTIYLRAGERVPVRDLLAAALIQSANDAAYALAAHVGKGNVRAFVRLMNVKARALGLDGTHFVRPDGLDVARHYSTARDVLALARAAMRRPLIRALVRMRRAAIAGGRTLATWNDLLGSFPGLIGVKTGHTADAGWSEVAAARRQGVAVYAVVLGSPSRGQRNGDLAELLEWGFDQYAHVALVRGDRAYASADVPFSDERIRLVAEDSAYGSVRVGRPLVEQVVAPATVSLPVERGEPLGEIRVYAGTRLLARRPLVAADEAPAPGFVERVGWYAGRALDEAAGFLSAF